MSRSTWGSTVRHGLLIAGLTLAVYWQVREFPFLGYDDPVYTYEDPLVAKGLSWQGVWEVFVGFRFANWHPLTWWSLMLDTTLFGLNPRAFHLMNVAIHVANSLLLYVWLRQTLGGPSRSLFAALLFAVHPLHVESVAWVSSRKDLVSTFFLLATLILYTRFARGPWDLRRYAAVLGTFALALMGKSMAVTLPVLLLILDVWPLRRWSLEPERAQGHHPSPRRLVAEKLPFFALAAIAGVLTFFAQQTSGALAATRYSLPLRAQNAVISCALYLVKTFVPTHLAVYYPLDSTLVTPMATLSAAALLSGLGIVAVLTRRTRPALALGLAWYLVSLLPVIGIVQLSNQARADRYTYVPLIGVFIALAWGAVPVRTAPPSRLSARGLAAAVFVLVLTGLAHVQTSYWRSNLALNEHAVEVVPGNFHGHANLAVTHLAARRLDRAEHHARQTLSLIPTHRTALLVLAECHFHRGQFAEAYRQYSETIPKLHPQDRPARIARAWRLLAVSAAKLGRISEAEEAFRKSIQAFPRDAEAYRDWSLFAHEQGLMGPAIERLEQGLSAVPGHAGIRQDLAKLLKAQGRTTDG